MLIELFGIFGTGVVLAIWLTGLIAIIYGSYCMFKMIMHLNKDLSNIENKAVILFNNEAFSEIGNKYRIRFFKSIIVFISMGILFAAIVGIIKS